MKQEKEKVSLAKVIAKMNKPQPKREGKEVIYSKYFHLVDQVLDMLDAKVKDTDINYQFRMAFAKANHIDKDFSKRADYRLFNALLFRAMRIAKHGRRWYNQNRELGFHRLYKLANAKRNS